MISADKRHEDVISIVNVEKGGKGGFVKENNELVVIVFFLISTHSSCWILGLIGCMHWMHAETTQGCLARVVVGVSVAESLMRRRRGKSTLHPAPSSNWIRKCCCWL